MKTKNWVIIILAIFITSTGFATEIPKMDIVSNNTEKIRVGFESVKACQVELTILCDDGTNLYYWKSKSPKERINWTFDLSNVKCGKYKVYLNYGEQSMYRELSVTQKGINTGPTVQLHQPFFSYSDDTLKLSFLNSGMENVYLNIYQDGDFINGVSLGKNLNIQKIINFSKLEKGEYDVVLFDNYSIHHYMVNK